MRPVATYNRWKLWSEALQFVQFSKKITALICYEIGVVYGCAPARGSSLVTAIRDKNVKNDNGDKKTFDFPMMNCIFLKEMCRKGYLIQIRFPRNIKSSKLCQRRWLRINRQKFFSRVEIMQLIFFERAGKIFLCNQYEPVWPINIVVLSVSFRSLFEGIVFGKKIQKIWVCWDCALACINFFCNRNLLERSDDKVSAEVVKLVSTFIDWHHIFYDCVKCLH